MKRNKIGMATAILVVMIAFTAILFLLKDSFSVANWLSYGLTMLALLLVGLRLLGINCSGNAAIYSPLLTITTAGFAVLQMVLGVFFLTFNTQLKAVLIVEILVYCAFLAITAILGGIRSSAEHLHFAEQAYTTNLQLLEQRVQAMADAAVNPDHQRALREVAESLRYANPYLNVTMAEVELKISNVLTSLQTEMNTEDPHPAELIRSLKNLIQERERLSKIV